MIIYKEKLRGLRYNNIWFANDRCPEGEIGCDIVNYMQADKPFITPYDERQTLINSLEISDEELFSNIEKTCRYEIQRARREGVNVKFYNSKELVDGNTIKNAADFQFEFLRTKNIQGNDTALQFEKLWHSYAKQGFLAITSAILEEQTVVYHIYLVAEDKVRLLNSASLFRNLEDKKKTQIIGMANRLLHWEDMMYFKQNGVREYDWGGYSYDPKLEGINKFKAAFGGEIVYTYYITFAVSFKANMYKYAKKIIKKLIGKA